MNFDWYTYNKKIKIRHRNKKILNYRVLKSVECLQVATNNDVKIEIEEEGSIITNNLTNRLKRD